VRRVEVEVAAGLVQPHSLTAAGKKSKLRGKNVQNIELILLH
jgi:hypothetical protein